MAVPVTKDQQVQLKIDDLGHEGDGVARHEGYVIFVSGAVPGEIVLVEITTAGSSFGRGRVLEILQSSSSRVSPPCEVFDRCGGCQLQHLDYDAQLTYKKKWVEQSLSRIAGVEGVKVDEVVPSEDPWGYRTRMRFSLDYSEGRAVLGFYEPGGLRVVDLSQCHLQSRLANRVLRFIRKMVLQKSSREFTVGVIEQVRDISIRVLGHQCMVVLRLEDESGPAAQQLADVLWRSRPDQLTSVVLLRKCPPSGHEVLAVRGLSRIDWRFAGLQVTTSPAAFTQVNLEAANCLYNTVLQRVNFQPSDKVVELYSGTGLLTALIAPLVGEIHAVDAEQGAVEDARKIAQKNGLEDAVSFCCADAADGFADLCNEGLQPDIVILDPPRQGCSSEVREQLVSCLARKIIYISCDFGTWSRDVREITDSGWHLESVIPVDMFPQTCNVEVVSLLTSRPSRRR